MAVAGTSWWGSHDLKWAGPAAFTPEQVYNLAFAAQYVYPGVVLPGGVVITDVVWMNRPLGRVRNPCPYPGGLV